MPKPNICFYCWSTTYLQIHIQIQKTLFLQSHDNLCWICLCISFLHWGKIHWHFLANVIPSLAAEQTTTSPLHEFCCASHSQEFNSWNTLTIQIYTSYLSYSFRLPSQALLPQTPRVFRFWHLQGSQHLASSLFCFPCAFRYHCVILIDRILQEHQRYSLL